MTARSTKTATNDVSRLDRARRSLGCRKGPFIVIAQLEQSHQDLVVGEYRGGAVALAAFGGLHAGGRGVADGRIDVLRRHRRDGDEDLRGPP